MRAVVQRVARANVTVEGAVTGEIGAGLMVLLGVGRADTRKDAEYLAAKVLGLRIFPDDAGKMNRSVTDIGGGVLVVSQFTLMGSVKKGMRPSFEEAATPDQARPLYEYFVELVRASRLPVGTGVFQASMSVELVNSGPVTILCESPGSAASGGGGQ